MNRRLIVLGPPGGGKGTLAGRLAKEMGVPHVSTGDMLRREVAERTDLGTQAKSFMDAGQLVPEDFVTAMTVKRLFRDDATNGWILDGFPRNLSQARSLEETLGPNGVELVVVLEVSDTEVIDRIGGRRSCPRGHVYHVDRHPPETEGVCDEDGLPLEQREDAAPEVMGRRLQIYKSESRPVLEFYAERGLVRRIDGMGAPEQVYRLLVRAVSENGGRHRPSE